MGSATRATKLGAELEVGDAVIFLNEPRIITGIEETDLGVVARTHPDDIPLLFAYKAPVEVEVVSPGPYDGYMSETEAGWHVTSGGVDLGIFTDEAVAATTLGLTTRRPRWKVTRTGAVTRLA